MSNLKVVKTSKLVDSINIDLKKYNPAKVSIKKYDLSKVAIDLDDFKISSNKYKPPTNIILRPERATVLNTNFAHQTRGNGDEIAKLCAPYVSSKPTQIVKWNKSMTLTTDKLKKVHTDLWGPHNLPSQSRSVYAAILICKYIQKM